MIKPLTLKGQVVHNDRETSSLRIREASPDKRDYRQLGIRISLMTIRRLGYGRPSIEHRVSKDCPWNMIASERLRSAKIRGPSS